MLSDGELIPSELIRRAEVAGYRGLVITDHVDESNMECVISGVLKVTGAAARGRGRLKVVAGVEITHVPPSRIAAAVREARRLGARFVVCHGETPVEPVAPGTNLAAIKAGVDLLSHPGLITERAAAMAADRGVALELTSRKGHSLANGHVARMAVKHGARLVVNTDAHGPADLMDMEKARLVVMGAGLGSRDFNRIRKNAEKLLERIAP